MTVLLQCQFPRSIDLLVKRLRVPDFIGSSLEAWLFEDATRRRTAESALRDIGIQARIRSAYKPLLHAFLEDVDIRGLASATISLPKHHLAADKRFQLEAYPLAGLLPDNGLKFVPGDDDLFYNVSLQLVDGRTDEMRIFAPNRVHLDRAEWPVLSPCGWIRLLDQNGRILEDGPLHTDFEQTFEAVMQTVRSHEWSQDLATVHNVNVAIGMGGIERQINDSIECMSTGEGLAEDIHFSIVEHFYNRAGMPPERTLQVGQIIPRIRSFDAAITTAEVSLLPPALIDQQANYDGSIDELAAPIHPSRLAIELQHCDELLPAARSVQNRPVLCAYVPGSGPGLVITAGRHGNETSGVVGALRAALQLKKSGHRNFAVIPLENPDGYALHSQLTIERPDDHHHAARYSALGDDIAFRHAPPWYESAARKQAFTKTGARLHVDLHGYPAHEWTRPLTGYVPRGFQQWTIPKGFFLMIDHPAGCAAAASRFVRLVAEQLSAAPGLREFNDAQLRTYRAHAGDPPFDSHFGILCQMAEVPEAPVPFTLVTEFPDQMIWGDNFKFAHDIQRATILAAVQHMHVLDEDFIQRQTP